MRKNEEYQHHYSAILNTQKMWIFSNLLQLAGEMDPSTYYERFGHVVHRLHYSKNDRVVRNSPSEITSWEKSPKMVFGGFKRDPLTKAGNELHLEG
jgi:hypothetical protein